MARFKGTLDETLHVKAPPAAVLAQFLDLDAILEHFGDLESSERLDDNTLRFLMEAQNHGVFSFQGRYACRYQASGDDGAEWATVEELVDGTNVWVIGRLKAAPGAEPGTTALHYYTEMELEIEVNAMLVPVLGPVVSASIPGQVKDYVKRMVKAVEAAQG